MTFHAGQQVQCIDDAPRKGRVWMGVGTKPKLWAVYTVTSVSEAEGTMLHLRELVNYENAGYRATRFRPVIERESKIDVSMFTKIPERAET